MEARRSASVSGSAGESRMLPQHTVKISQRPTKSCTECIRRKTRCDKQVPCNLCLKRGVAHLCHLESQYVIFDTAQTSHTSQDELVLPPTSDIESLRVSIFEELESLRKRVFELETAAALRNGPSSSSRRSTAPLTNEHRSSSQKPFPSSHSENVEPETEDAATTLEFFALGVDRRRGASDGEPGSRGVSPGLLPPAATTSTTTAARSTQMQHILVEPFDKPVPESITDALLPQGNVQSILQFAESSVLWQHCCVYFPGFWSEVDAFWATLTENAGWNTIDPTWVALFYVLQGVAVHQMTDREAEVCGLAEGDRYVLPNALISAAEDALNLGQFLSRPTLWTVQACAILSVCGHNVCESELLSSLLAVGIKTAQALNLHSLGRLSDHLAKTSGMSTSRTQKVIDVEVGKRIWWSLTQQDWFIIPFRGVWSIHPDHFDTPLPNNCHDQDLKDGLFVARPDTTLTVAFKQRFSSQVASILQNFFHELNRDRSKPSFSSAESSAGKIRHLIRSLPPYLRADATPTDNALPAWTQVMRHYLHISSNHKILIIYRAFLSRGGSARERVRAHDACIEAAETILSELERGGREEGSSQALWTIPYHGLAAAVVLALDMIALSGKPEAALRRESVLRAKVSLEKLAPTSRIARRGLQVLGDLLREAEEAARGKRRQSSDAMVRMVKKIRLPANEMVETFHPSPSEEPAISTAPGPSPEWPMTLYPNLFDFSQEETNQLLLALQQSVPDVGRLFDGSIGDFNWQSS